MINYDLRIEKCKREDTKELMIQCLDKATVDYHRDKNHEWILALEISSIIFIVAIITSWILSRFF